MRIFIGLLFCFCFFAYQPLLAQIDYSQKYGGTQQQSTTDSLPPDAYLGKDTFNFHYFYPDNIDKEFPYQDTTIERFQNYDPIRQQEWDYGALGNLGSAHFPFVYQPVQRGGFEVGFRQFELYKTTYDEFAFYRLRKAFTRLHFTQGQTQQDTYTQAIFTRNFAKGLNLSFDFKRMNHTGQYQNQKAENTSLLVGLWYKSPDRRYDAFISFVSNTIYQQENGGIDLNGLNETNINNPFDIPTQLSSNVANTAHTERAFHYHQRFLFNKQRVPKRKAPPVEPYLLGNDSTNLLTDSLLMDSISVDSIPSDRPTDSTTVMVTDSMTTDSVSLEILREDTLEIEIKTTDSLSVTTPRKTTIEGNSVSDSLLNNTITTDTLLLDSLGRPLKNTPLVNDSLRSKKDSIVNSQQIIYDQPFKKRKRDYAFSHHGIFQVSKYKFSDTNPAADSSYYGDLQVDNRGLRYFIRDRKLENIFTLNTTKVEKKGGESAIKKQKDFFEVGLRHSLHFVRQEPRDTIINNLFLQGRWHLAPIDRLKIETYADLGLIDNAGDYHLHADLFFDLKNAGQVKARVMHQSYSPTLMEYQHLLSQKQIWKNNFDKTFETSVSLSYHLPQLKLELIGQYHLLNQYIYFNARGISEQYNSPLSIGQLTLKKDFKVWKLHLNNRITVQQTSKSVIRLPELYSWHSLYYEGILFKKVLNVQLGADLRLYSPFEAPGYQPAIGQFYLETYEADDDEPYTYPDIDLFVNFKVKTFRFFVKQENLLSYFTDDFNYQAKGYTMPYAYLRFGVSWQFLD